MFNYSNLSDVEFENLCRDVMAVRLGRPGLRCYAEGRDRGIDISDESKDIVIQVKHYRKSRPDQLEAAIKSELSKVRALAPKEYYICCSQTLSRGKVDEIFSLFAEWMDSTDHIVTVDVIDEFLKEPAHAVILERHFKLWLDSLEVMRFIEDKRRWKDCERMLAQIEDKRKLFVATSAYGEALKALEEAKTLFITGNPGVGKTMTSEMLVLYFVTQGYTVRYVRCYSDFGKLREAVAENENRREIFLVDDCLGQSYLQLNADRSSQLCELIDSVNYYDNKLLILNSRITVLNEAGERNLELMKHVESMRNRVCVLNMDALSLLEKATIFHNHLYFSDMGDAYFAEIKKDKRYFNIIEHRNYTPRIIEFICNRYRKQQPSEYYEYAMRQLDNPQDIWRDEFEHNLEPVDRLLLLTLYSLSEDAVEELTLKTCFADRLSCEPGIDTSINQYEAALARLLDGFVKVTLKNGRRELSMVNPSVNDFLNAWLKENSVQRQKIIDSSHFIRQKVRMLSSSEFEDFVHSALQLHEIDNYRFDNDEQKCALISSYVGQYSICDEAYAPYLHRYVTDPLDLRMERYSEVDYAVLEKILKKELVAFYGLSERLVDANLPWLLTGRYHISIYIDVINMLSDVIEGDLRTSFVQDAKDALRKAVELHCEDMDAEFFCADVDAAISLVSSPDGSFELEDVVSLIEEDIRADVRDDMEQLLADLAPDLGTYQDYRDCVNIGVYGVKRMVRSHLREASSGKSRRQNAAGDEEMRAEIERMFSDAPTVSEPEE